MDYNILNKIALPLPWAILFQILVHYSVIFNFGHIRSWDQCTVHILFFFISLSQGS